MDKRPIPNVREQLLHLMARLRNRSIDTQLLALIERTRDERLSDTEKTDLLHRQQALRQLKLQPIPPPEG